MSWAHDSYRKTPFVQFVERWFNANVDYVVSGPVEDTDKIKLTLTLSPHDKSIYSYTNVLQETSRETRRSLSGKEKVKQTKSKKNFRINI